MTMAIHLTAPAMKTSVRSSDDARPLTVCHFTTAHADLKSRSFHRQMMPLASGGMRIRYLAPMRSRVSRDRVDFVALPPRKGQIGRMLASFGLIPALLRQRADVYHFQDPELLPATLALKLVFRKRVVYDAYEDFPSMAAASRSLPRLSRTLAARLVGLAEQMAARCFDGLMTADPLTLRRLAKIGGSKKLVFYNFPNLDFFPHPISRAKPFDLVYRGGLSERAGTFVLLNAMHLLAERDRPVRLLLIGYFDGAPAEREIRERIETLGLAANIVVGGRMGHEQMAEALAEARVGVCPLRPIPKFMRNIPVKAFEYWACGLPVVASDLPPIRPFLRHGEGGLLYSPESADQLAEAIGWMLDHPRAAVRMGRRGRELVAQRFNNRFEIHKLQRFFEEIVKGDSCPKERVDQESYSICSNRS